MRILVIGATGSIGSVAATTLAERGHEVIRASRSSPVSVDITDPASIAGLFTRVGEVDGVVVASGAVPFQPLTDLEDRKSTRLNSSHVAISYAVFCLKKKKVIILHYTYITISNN